MTKKQRTANTGFALVGWRCK